VVIGRDRVGDIARFSGPSTGPAVATVIKIEDAKTILAHRFNFGRAIGGVGPITMEIEDGWLAFPSPRVPSDQRDAIADMTPFRSASAGRMRVGSGTYMNSRLPK